MNAIMRLVSVGCFMGLLAVGVFGLRLACTPMDLREVNRSAELEDMRRATDARLKAKDQVVSHLIAQRHTLAEAIEQFLELDRQWPDLVSKVQDSQSQQERTYQYIRWKIENKLHDRPDQASIVLRRLEQEYEKLCGNSQSHLFRETFSCFPHPTASSSCPSLAPSIPNAKTPCANWSDAATPSGADAATRPAMPHAIRWPTTPSPTDSTS